MAFIATCNREDALDIVQDAMLKLARHYPDRDKEELAMLFHRVMQNQIRDWYRRDKVKRSLGFLFIGGNKASTDECTEDPIGQIPDARARRPEENLANTNSMRELERALKQLPLRQNQAFLLRVMEGLDVAQTANAMGCSAGSVKTHFSRAVHSLRSSLGEHWL